MNMIMSAIAVVIFFVLAVFCVKVMYLPTKIVGKVVSVEIVEVKVRGSVQIVLDTGERIAIGVSNIKELNETSALAGKQVTIVTNKYGRQKESYANFVKINH